MPRRVIRGRLTTTAPLHVGSGGITSHPDLVQQVAGGSDATEPCDVAAVVRAYDGRPCIPGTAIKGVLRSWAERFYPDDRPGTIRRVFGHQGETGEDGKAGGADFLTAFMLPGGEQNASRFGEFVNYVPYWRPERVAGILSHVVIDSRTGAAKPGGLFFEEFVPEGVTFAVEVAAARLSDADLAFVLAVLEHGSGHETHPYQFGANGANGWGRMTWCRDEVCEEPGGRHNSERVGYGVCTARVVLPPAGRPEPAPECQLFDLALDFQGPFLVNDASRAKRDGMTDDEKRRHTNFTPLRRAGGDVWLPAASFRGVLRSRMAFLAESGFGDRAGIDRVFGSTGRATRLTVPEFGQVGTCAFRHQDFVAIDRFTGGAADGAKFDARYADRPKLRTQLRLDTAGLNRADQVLFARALRDICCGEVAFGFGGSKGYGAATGALDEAAEAWVSGAVSELPAAVGGATAGSSPPAPPAGPPEELTPGRLTVSTGDAGLRAYSVTVRVRGKDKQLRVRNDAVSWELHTGEVIDAAVECVVADDKPTRVRPAGQAFVTPPPTAAPLPAPPVSRRELRADRFAHAYYFLRMEDRSAFTSGDLADKEPATHDRYEPGLYSGTLRVKLTTATELLTCGPPNDPNAGHKTYPVLMDGDAPLLAASSVRGMLRSAFEAVTNSRFGVFPFREGDRGGHARRLGYRTPAQSGLGLVPVRIESHTHGLQARLLPGTASISSNGRPAGDGSQYAAWVARYDRSGWQPGGATGATHGRAAWAYVGPWWHDRRNFGYWNVEAFDFGATRPAAPPDVRFRANRQSARQAEWASPQWVGGWVCVTERNIDGKHDERFFFEASPPQFAELTASASAAWTDLITDYQEQHQAELAQGITRPPALRDECRFSRHITADLRTSAARERTLAEGTLCYASVVRDGTGFRVSALYPVMISRKLHDRSPLDLLPPKLRPATSREHLSPADRVFGWVSQGAGDAPPHRSLVRVGPVKCVTPDAVERFPQGPKPLAILGQPKPAQGRFYLGRKDGTAQNLGLSKLASGYSGDNRVRGPKVYPHHPEFQLDETFNGPQPDDAGSSQNRSVEGYVRRGVTFEFDLRIHNLTGVELGALTWLLSLPAGHFLRLGLGKPLGFGSVHTELDRSGRTTVATGSAWAASGSRPPLPNALADLAKLAREFEATMAKANATLLKAFLKAAAGVQGVVTCYPPAQGDTQHRGQEHFEWFVDNEKKGQFPLPDLTSLDPTLPIPS